jgi:hypothetical protein
MSVREAKEFADTWRNASVDAARLSDRWGDEVREAILHIDALLSEIERLTRCDCGQQRGEGQCMGHCDNDE